MSSVASAPGKILIAGEYVVVDGATAVLIAVNRRARAWRSSRPQQLSPFLRAAKAVFAREFGASSIGCEVLAHTVASTSALRSEHDIKLGLGSSAAVTVAALALALRAQTGAVDRPLLHRLAHTSHGEAQLRMGARGSGADIAASTFGGVLSVLRDPTTHDINDPLHITPLSIPANFYMVSVWTGTPADTATLVAKVRALRSGDPAGYARLSQPIADAAADLIGAFSANDGPAAVTALDRGASAIAALGDAAEIALASPLHHRLTGIARACGGTCKPTGAGGGDIALAAFATLGDADNFRQAVRQAGMNVLNLSVDYLGVDYE